MGRTKLVVFHLLQWDFISKPKKQGGLNVRNVVLWNKTAMGKYIWQVTMKEDNLWVKWVHGIYIRDGDFWNHIPPPFASWSWKKLCSVRSQFASGYVKNVQSLHPQGSFRTAEAYKWLNQESSKVPWRYWVWNKLNIPKHSFICWMMMWGKL